MTASRASHSRSRRFPERAKRGRRAGGLRGWSMKRIGLIAAVSTYQRPSAKWANGDPAPGVRQWSWARSWWFEDRLLRCSRGGHLRFPEYGAYLYRPGAGVTIRGTQDQGLADSLLSHQHRNGKIGEHRAQGQGPSLNGQALARGAFIEILAGSMRTSYPGHGLRLTRAVPRPSGT